MRASDPDHVVFSVGRRIAELRRKRRLTQAQLAEKADVSVKYVQRIEAGATNLTIRSLVLFANVLGTRIGELFRAPSTRTVRRGRPRSRR